MRTPAAANPVIPRPSPTLPGTTATEPELTPAAPMTPALNAGAMFQSPEPGAVPTLLPTEAPTPTPTPTAAPALPTSSLGGATATAVPTPVAGSSQGSVRGRVLLDGAPAPAGLVLHLQTQAYDAVGETTVTTGGEYSFVNVPDSGEGYDVTFAQEWNDATYQRDTVATWAWLGPVVVQNGAELRLPDLDISLLGMKPLTPTFAAQVSAQAIAAGQPIDFTWSSYPQAGAYWLDLTGDPDNATVWQSPLLQIASGSWNGRSADGAPVAPGEYWWSVGARRDVSSYTLIVYSYLTRLIISAN